MTDQFNNRVQVLNPEGENILTFGEPGSGPGQFIQPIDLEVDEFENIYVADSINSRIQVFDKDGKFLSEFGEAAAGRPPQLGEPSPYGNPLDLTPGTFNWTAGTYYDPKDKELYVGDFFQGRVQVLDVEQVPEPSSVLGLAVLGVGAAGTLIRKNRRNKRAVNVTK